MSCNFTCCHLAISTPVLGFQGSPALLLSQKKSWYGQQFLQISLRKLNNTIPIHRPLQTFLHAAPSATCISSILPFLTEIQKHASFLKKSNQSHTEKADQNWSCHCTCIFPRGEVAKANKTWQILVVVFNALLEGAQIL